MNEIQLAYLKTKAAYDAAAQLNNWDLVDDLCEPLVDTQFKLIDWTFEEVAKTGEMATDQIEFLKKNMSVTQMDQIADLGLRLRV